MQRTMSIGLGSLVLASMITALCGSNVSAAPSNRIEFDMGPSQTAINASCLSNASGHVLVKSQGPVETMNVSVSGLPPNTDFDFFVIQHPDGPFGMSWYQGDINTDDEGNGEGRFIGRFSIETFIVAPGVANAPVVFSTPGRPDLSDASQNPATPPVQLYHLGLWFNNPADAAAAGGPSTITPFNGEHNAGVQVLNTQTPAFPDNFGPLRHVSP